MTIYALGEYGGRPWEHRRKSHRFYLGESRKASQKRWHLSCGKLQTAGLIGKDPDAGKDWGQEEKGVTEDGMFGWHHQLNRHQFEQTLGNWRTGRAHVLPFIGVQRVRQDLVTEQKQGLNIIHTLKMCILNPNLSFELHITIFTLCHTST